MKRTKAFFFCGYYILCFFVLQTVDVKAAYIDPSVMTYAIQALAGVAIGLGTFFGLYWNRIRKTVLGPLAEEEKEKESDLLEFSDPKTGTVRSLHEEKASPQAEKKPGDPHFHNAMLLCLALSFLLFFYTPLNLFFTNINEFRYDLHAFGGWIVLLFLIGFLLTAAVFLLFYRLGKKPFLFLLAFAMSALVAFYVQNSFLNGTLPPADGSPVDWNKYTLESLQSLFLWVLSIWISFGLLRKNRRYFAIYVRLGSVFIFLLLVCTLSISAYFSHGLARKQTISVTKDNLNMMSEDKNFIILVLDAVDAHAFSKQLETTDPEYREYFEDFTYYPDTLSAYPYTTTAIPEIITGQWYECQKDYRQYFADAIKTSEFLNTLRKENYIGGMYDSTDFLYDDPVMYQYENIHELPYSINNPYSFLMDELSVIYYLNMPYPLKKYRENAVYHLQTRNAGNPRYFEWYNDEFYRYLQETPIASRSEKTFKFIHLEGAHPFYRLDKNLNDIRKTGNPDYYTSLEGAMTAADTYLKKLKEAGVYDNSVILIMADHGFPDGNDCNARHNPLFLIKGFGEHHPFAVSDQPMSYAWLPEIYQNLLEGASGGEVLQYDPEQENVRRYLWHDYNDFSYMEEYVLKNRTAAEEDALEKTGVTYSRTPQK